MSHQSNPGRGVSRARFLRGTAAGAAGLVLSRLGVAEAASPPASPFDLVPGQLIPATGTTTAYLGVGGFKVLDGYPSARLVVLDTRGGPLAEIGMEHPRSNGPTGFSGRDTTTITLPSGASASRSSHVSLRPGSRTIEGSVSIVAGEDRLDADVVFDVVDRPGGMQPAYRVRGGEVRSPGGRGRIRSVDRPFVVAATSPEDTNDLHDALQAFDQAGKKAGGDAVLASPLYRLLAQVHADPQLLIAEAMAIGGPGFAQANPWIFPTSLDCMLGKTVEQSVSSLMLHHLSCMTASASIAIDQSAVHGFDATWSH
jgi:hypothetical protein